MLKISSLSQTLTQTASLNEIAPPRKSASQDAAATSKGKSIVVGDVEPIDAHPPHFDVHIEDVGEDYSFPAVAPR